MRALRASKETNGSAAGISYWALILSVADGSSVTWPSALWAGDVIVQIDAEVI